VLFVTLSAWVNNGVVYFVVLINGLLIVIYWMLFGYGIDAWHEMRPTAGQKITPLMSCSPLGGRLNQCPKEYLLPAGV